MDDASSAARDAAAAAAAALVEAECRLLRPQAEELDSRQGVGRRRREPGLTIGLGSGRAVWRVVALLGERLAADGDLAGAGLRAVAASSLTDELARAAGIDLVELDGTFELDLTLDGADEIDGSMALIKGGGGALLREKIVVAAARRFVVVAESSKRVERLGERFRLPVEVVRFGWRDTRRRLGRLLPGPELRRREDGEPYVTDERHLILDCALPDDADLASLDARLKQVPGVMEHGLFIGMAERALLGRPDGTVEVLEREPA